MTTPSPSLMRQAVLAQTLAALPVLAWLLLGPPDAPALLRTPLVLAGVQGGLAAAWAAWRGAPRWWWVIHALFMPLTLVAQAAAWPAWVWGLGFVTLALVFWRTDTSRVPLYLTNRASADALARLLPDRPVHLVDLGCGDARVLRRLARQRPDCRFTGFEHAPLTWLWARVASAACPNVQVRYGSFWGQALGAYDVVYAFLSPVPMPRLWDKVCAELAPGGFLVSNSFEVPGVTPTGVAHVGDGRGTQLLVYEPPAQR